MDNSIKPDRLFDLQWKILGFFGFRLKYLDDRESKLAKIRAFYFSAVALVFSMILMANFAIVNIDNLDRIVEIVPAFMLFIAMVVRFAVIYFWREPIGHLMQELGGYTVLGKLMLWFEEWRTEAYN